MSKIKVYKQELHKTQPKEADVDDKLLDDILADLNNEGEAPKDVPPPKQAKQKQQEQEQEQEQEQKQGQQEQKQDKGTDHFRAAVVAVNESEGFIRADALDQFASKIKELAGGPSIITIKMPDGSEIKREIEGKLHKSFDEVVQRIKAKQDVALVGPAGSGKTTLGEQVAKALGLSFGTISCTAGTPESHILGRSLPDGTGKFVYRPTQFVNIAEAGGVFLADEFDAADANVMLVFNQYLANGRLPLPMREDAPIAYRHEDARFIAALNTFGRGADRQYVGRNQLDEATLDRFACNIVEIDYDRDLERSLVAPEIAERFWKLRDAVLKHKLRRIVSTRAMVKADTLVRAAGFKLDRVMSDFLAGWTPDERSRIGF